MAWSHLARAPAGCALVAAALCLAALPSGAVTTRLAVGGLASPVEIVHAGDASGRIFVAEQGGTIRIVRGGALMAAPFLDIGGRVLAGGERGLLGVAFHPRYAVNGRFFVDYTQRGDGATVIAEYRVSAADPDAADAASERILLTIGQPYPNHNGGALRFGPDGYLYIGMATGVPRTTPAIARRTRANCSARSCGSTSIAGFPMRFLRAIRSRVAADGSKSGRRACATRGVSTSIG